MASAPGASIGQLLLETFRELSEGGKRSVSPSYLLDQVFKKMNRPGDHALKLAILDHWNELFRGGQFAWGDDGGGWQFDACHATAQGRRTLEKLSRDPLNKDGYLAHLASQVALDPIAHSYLSEALETYRAGCYKATAVLVGTASEGLILALRDRLVEKLEAAKKPVPKDLKGWQIRAVSGALQAEVEKVQKHMPRELAEAFTSFWPALIGQVRLIRNASGHPNSINPVSPESVHAALLLFPDLARLHSQLMKWVSDHPF